MNRAQRRRKAAEPDHATLVRRKDRIFVVGRATGLGRELFKGYYARSFRRALAASDQVRKARQAAEDAAAEELPRIGDA